MRALKFYSVGAMGLLLQLGVLWLLHAYFQMNLVLSTVLAVEAALLHNFAWHEGWTWRDRPATRRESAWRVVKFHLANGLISMVGNVALTSGLHQVLGVNYLLANGVSVSICACANFLAGDRLIFRSEV